MADQAGPNNTPQQAKLAEIVRDLSILADKASSLFFMNSEGVPEGAQLQDARPSVRSQRALLGAAKQAYALRRYRSSLFKGEDLFGEPAWDLLLDLYIADLQGTRLSITDACIGAAVPATTALRWITILQKANFAERHGDPRDGRRAYLQLTRHAADLMQAYFERVLDLNDEANLR